MIQPHGSRSWRGKGIGGILVSVAKPFSLLSVLASIPLERYPLSLTAVQTCVISLSRGKRADRRPEPPIAER